MCPPGVDQTGRTEQTWQLIAPCIQQSSSLAKDGDRWSSNILQNIFDPENMFGAMEKLARPVRPSGSELPLTSLPTEGATATSTVERSNIEALPVEMVLAILESGDLSKDDILSLALSSPYLLPVIASYIQSSYVKVTAPWAGTPVACVGNYTLDLPAAFMEDEVLAGKFEDWEKNTPPPRYIGGGRGMAKPKRGLPPSRRFFWDCAAYAKPSSPSEQEMEWMKALKDLEPHCIETDYLRQGFESLSSQLACPDLYPGTVEWVLRNLTKKEYYIPQPFPTVARTKLTKLSYRYSEDQSTVAVPEVLGFDDVLLLKTGWTSICRDSLEWNKQGDWAGDCFDIVKKGVFEQEGWRDIGTELAVVAKKCWDLLTGEAKNDYEE
jgi:hypothetical protein